ncbi:DUF4258 domain-containing protein [Saccharopolyspora gregorii]|uniref:DUF4258 domain-containing protein n=1 Tax=Saccharopolyspora gregorii TaxID=33914 RepID=UPI0021ACBA3E|nr:DUF4258 domain-containing protein [Saccharopolyspora gregorii]
MRIESIEWDDANLEHATRHGVSADEIDQAISNPTKVARNKRARAASHLLLGRTRGGRPILVAIAYDEPSSTVRPITAWEAT